MLCCVLSSSTDYLLLFILLLDLSHIEGLNSNLLNGLTLLFILVKLVNRHFHRVVLLEHRAAVVRRQLILFLVELASSALYGD